MDGQFPYIIKNVKVFVGAKLTSQIHTITKIISQRFEHAGRDCDLKCKGFF